MSAIDELRRLLDERGLSYQTHYHHILWHEGSKLREAVDNFDGTLTVDGLTPEQVIAATLGTNDAEKVREALEFERAENGWVREFLDRIAPKCGCSDCRSLVDYVEQLEAKSERTCEAKLCCDGFYRCTECGWSILPSSNYCSHCGATVQGYSATVGETLDDL